MKRALNLLAAVLVAGVLLAVIVSAVEDRAAPWLWLAALVAAGLWVAGLVRQARHAALPVRRRWAGDCLICGYDLTGNVSGVCPECGTPTGGPAAGGGTPGEGAADPDERMREGARRARAAFEAGRPAVKLVRAAPAPRRAWPLPLAVAVAVAGVLLVFAIWCWRT